METQTWIQDECFAYPNGAMDRRGRARLAPNPHNPISLPYGRIVAFRAGIADTYFTIPAFIKIKGKRVRCFVTSNDGELTIQPEANPDLCTVCASGTGCKRA